MVRLLYTLCGADASVPFSPHCWKVVLALKHKGLDFEEKSVGFTEISQLENGFSKTVPFLKDGDHMIADSFAIAQYLERTYPNAPSLFKGEGGVALSRFVEKWALTTLHPAVTKIVIKDIHDMLSPNDQAYFRTSRENKLGVTLEEFASKRDEEIKTFSAKCEPLRVLLKDQAFIGGDTPLYADYIVFSTLQWAAKTTNVKLLAKDDVVTSWFERCAKVASASSFA